MTKIAVVQYEVERLSSWQGYEDKIVRLVELAKEKEADLLTMSEYAGFEIASWTNGNLIKQFEFVDSLKEKYIELYLSLAKKYQLYIQPGSLPIKENDGYYRNRAFIFSPQNNFSYQDKLFLTPFEKNSKVLRPGSELRLFETNFAKIGINICYDIEFPDLTKQLVASGAHLILVPSCTERLSGLTRVTMCCRARAIENQCYVAQSCLMGKASWSKFIDINTGQSGIYCPADISFYEDGVLTQAQLNTPMLIYADLDWDKISHIKHHGEMTNFKDAQLDMRPTLNAMNTINV